ncbi:MAG: MTAP family purine nucleoside phosphorylase [Asgard group archaeon]|nr:MTAP family purine nucleoside phosphorylase [Asgard group archaeon]
MKGIIGVIGGSGFYALSDESEKKSIKTPFGKIDVAISTIGEMKIAFITRHGEKHNIPPHLVDYKSNILALYSVGADRIISSSAVGSMIKDYSPGTFIIPSQFIDLTSHRPKTFFDGEFAIKLHSGVIKEGVVHTDMTIPYCPELQEKIVQVGKKLSINIIPNATYICTEGPRFETPAEINAYRSMGGTIVGMTSASECILARELGMCYSTICLVTNYAAGMQQKITTQEVFEMFKSKIIDLRKIILEVCDKIDAKQSKCKCSTV